MKIELWVTGKTIEPYLQTGIEMYTRRIRHYLPFEMLVLPPVRRAGKYSAEQLKNKEGEIAMAKLHKEDFLVLLDERGRQFTSERFAQYLQQKLHLPYRRIVFLVGGAYGFSRDLYRHANEQLALSRMTFSHRMIRLFFVEQLYRAMTIMRNEPYHNP
jgi:23S rRNA (pseudouridine1915-N3)-methyltransferase